MSRTGPRVSLVSSRRDLGFMRSPKQKLGYRLLAGMFDQVQAVSEEVRQYSIAADRLDPEKVVTIPNGIEVRPFDRDRNQCRAALGLPLDAPVICSVGHIRHVKGTDVLVRTAEKVSRRFPEAIFLIAGCMHEPDLYNSLQNYLREKGLARNVRFLGRCDDVPQLLRASDVFCLMSRSEGMSNAVLEAMSAQLPCVVSSVGGNPEVIESGRTGFLVPSENVEAAANAVATLLRNPDLRTIVGERARRSVAEQFSVDKMISRMAAQYERLVNGKEVAVPAAPAEAY